MGLMLYVGRWWSALIISTVTQVSGSLFAPGRAVAGTGLALFLEASLYLQREFTSNNPLNCNF